MLLLPFLVKLKTLFTLYMTTNRLKAVEQHLPSQAPPTIKTSKKLQSFLSFFAVLSLRLNNTYPILFSLHQYSSILFFLNIIYACTIVCFKIHPRLGYNKSDCYYNNIAYMSCTRSVSFFFSTSSRIPSTSKTNTNFLFTWIIEAI